MSSTVGSLILGGLVLATPSAEDGRRRELHLTDTGRDLVEAVRPEKVLSSCPGSPSLLSDWACL
jgi:DNA-binding MarR family transcriptional regulator